MFAFAKRAMDFLDVDERHLLTEEDLVKILTASWGTKKGVGDRENTTWF